MALYQFYQHEAIQDKGRALRCTLCPHRCLLGAQSGESAGLCRVRVYDPVSGILKLPYYGRVSALARDPIEKKPLYHWRPGSSILSAGFFGCNLRCPFCQNWRISQIAGNNASENACLSAGRSLAPHELIAEAYDSGDEGRQIAYTYSEPLVHAEYLIDCMEAAREKGIANVLITNGCVNAPAAEAVLSRTDAVNIDLKCFSRKTYSQVLGGSLEAVLDCIRRAVSLGVHTEITTLVVPGLNDSEAELTAIAEFIAGLDGNAAASIPWHLSAYHPGWKWNALPTSQEALAAVAAKARAVLSYVYTGNITGERNDTVCASCGALLVRRLGYRVDAGGLRIPPRAARRQCKHILYRCAACGAATALRIA